MRHAVARAALVVVTALLLAVGVAAATQVTTAPLGANLGGPLRSCVKVFTSSSQGTGIIVNNRTVLTNAHVVGSARTGEIVQYDGATVDWKIIKRDGKVDLAVLRTTKPIKMPAVTWADSRRLQEGDPVVALGYPLGVDRPTATRGIVSSPSQPIDGQHYVQTDAAVNHGNSGGPLVDEQGRVVGVNTFGLRDSDGTTAEGMHFAIPSVRAAAFLKRTCGIVVSFGSGQPAAGDGAPTQDAPSNTQPRPPATETGRERPLASILKQAGCWGAAIVAGILGLAVLRAGIRMTEA